MASIHFTYNDIIDKESLKQGDILQKTEKLDQLLRTYHPHYSNPEYTHFQVLTQTCDLVRRGSSGQCSSRYITVAAVRNLETVITRTVEQFADKRIEIDDTVYCSDKHRDRLSSAISSLFNNNDKNFFFLKASPKHGLLDDSCTFLHLSVALKANDHYTLCLEAKELELKENFRAKLGWMVGNLYSRVGTEDYVPAALPNNEAFNQLILETLEKYVAWVPGETFPDFRKAAQPGKSFAQILNDATENLKVRRDQRVRAFIQLLRSEAGLDGAQLDKVRGLLNTKRGRKFIKLS